MTESTFRTKLLKNQVLRFIFSSGIGFLVYISTYYILYGDVFQQKTYSLYFFLVSNSTLSLALSFFLGVLVNFSITRYLVFNESRSSHPKQFVRFTSVAILGFFANLLIIKFLVQYFKMYPPVAGISASLSLFFASFFVHKFFSFSLSLRHHGTGKNNA